MGAPLGKIPVHLLHLPRRRCVGGQLASELATLRRLPVDLGACGGLARALRLQPDFGRVFGHRDPSEVRSVLNFDHTVVAVHSDASVWLLPYVTDLDAHCQWVSQWRLSSLANALFPQHVLLTHKVLVKNPHHATYSKSRCLELMRRVTLELREAVAPEARSCFVEPSNQALLLEGAPKLTAYLPWSHPLRRAQAEPWRRNYSAPDFARRMRSCIHEPVVQAVEQAQKSEASEEESYSWCRGCSLAVAYAVLQVIISSRPFDFTGWVKLANLAAKGAARREDLVVAASAVAVAGRLLWCGHGIPGTQINWKELAEFRAAFGEWGIVLAETEQQLQDLENMALLKADGYLYNTVRAALSPAEDSPAANRPMISDENLQMLVELVKRCPGPGVGLEILDREANADLPGG
ncbi:unnamed protein product [Effrenium voratum]|uniref:Uncharacterized protein n=1 Tax=Effrenium voratum TaxID=2562239 RepID=A0AA36NDV3_9DINO|nr:unnamed protein product [Effrenium voratum]